MKVLAASAALCFTAFLLGGCASGPRDTAPSAASGSVAPSHSDVSEPGTPSVSAEGCGGLTTEKLNLIFAATLSGPATARRANTHNDVTWTDAQCEWEDDSVDLDIDLDIALSKDFPDGKIVCFEPVGFGDPVSVEGLGSSAWWMFDDAFGAEGKLRVCTPDALVELEIDAESTTATPDQMRDNAVEAVREIVG